MEKNLKKIFFNFGLDHLEVFGTFKYEKDFFEKLDFDNSNYTEFEEYIITKSEVNRYKYKIIFTKDNYTLFAYYKGLKKGKGVNIATKDYICIYSTAFKLLEYEEILAFLQLYFDLMHCRRFDIYIDLKINIEQLLSYFNDYNTGREYKKSGEIETRYIGEVKNSLNKRYIIRVYNKIRDILVKKKIKLYQDYLLENNITRIELEVRQNLARNIDYTKIFDDYLLLGIFKNYLKKQTDIFNDIEAPKITLYKSNKKINPEDFQSLYYRTQRKNIFIGHAKTIYNLGFCPVRILIGEGYIQGKTKILLGAKNIIDLHNKERELKQRIIEDKYIQENANEILANLYKYGKI